LTDDFNMNTWLSTYRPLGINFLHLWNTCHSKSLR
jgi:hypothetical protein